MRNNFAENMNPFGMPSTVQNALMDAATHCEAYPGDTARRLATAIGGYYGLDPNRICCGGGSRSLIYRIIFTFRPKKGLVFTPTYPLYQRVLEDSGCEVDEYLLKEANDFQPDAGMTKAIHDTKPDIVFLANPNCPTGSTVSKNQLADMIYACRKMGARLVIDECYMDFVMGHEDYSILREVETMNGVIVLRSFSASFAMEGLRVGYCICGNPADARAIIDKSEDRSISVLGCEAAIAAMSALDFADKSRVFVALERERLIAGLLGLGFRTYRTQANFILFHSTMPLAEVLRPRDIQLLDVTDIPGLAERPGYFYRISVRSKEENKNLLAVLADLTEK